jgi:hypothetical protein
LKAATERTAHTLAAGLATSVALAKGAFQAVLRYVPLIALGISIASLFVAIKILSLQLTANRPELVFTTGSLKTERLDLQWNNVGKRVAWGAAAKLFGADNPGGKPLAEADINRETKKVFPGEHNSGTASYLLSAETLPRRLLACVTYSDDDGRTYTQAFMLSVPETWKADGTVIEQTRTDDRKCR